MRPRTDRAAESRPAPLGCAPLLPAAGDHWRDGKGTPCLSRCACIRLIIGRAAANDKSQRAVRHPPAAGDLDGALIRGAAEAHPERGPSGPASAPRHQPLLVPRRLRITPVAERSVILGQPGRPVPPRQRRSGESHAPRRPPHPGAIPARVTAGAPPGRPRGDGR